MNALLRVRFWKYLVLAATLTLLIVIAPFATAQESSSHEGNKIDGFPVLLGSEEVFIIQKGIGEFTAKDRVEAISERLEAIAQDETLSADDLTIESKDRTTTIEAGDRLIVTLTDADAKAAEQGQKELAKAHIKTLRQAINRYRHKNDIKRVLSGLLWTAIATVGLVVLFNVLNYAIPRVYRKLEYWQKQIIPTLRSSEKSDFMSSGMSYMLALTSTLISSSIQLFSIVLIFGIPCIYLTLVLSFFTSTQDIKDAILAYVATGNLFKIIIAIFITYYILIVLRLTFAELGRGTISLSWFYPEWAEPTYKVISFLAIVGALVVIFPYIPGSDSLAFQGISVFLGIVISLGSSSAIANIVSGIILIYTRAFKVGDFVKIADSTGTIVEKTLLVTRLCTPKNIIITIPNTTILSSSTINFTASVRDKKITPILHVTITLGYDVPWRKVDRVLQEAARNTEFILEEPQPFILQTSLDDFYVSYQLNAYTENPEKMSKIYSKLYQNIQDKCNENDIEILSPHYSAIRDGNQITIPEEYLDKDYRAPGFRVNPLGNLPNLLPQSKISNNNNNDC